MNMSMRRATLLSVIILTSFVTLKIFFASIYTTRYQRNPQTVSLDGYGITDKVIELRKQNNNKNYRTAFRINKSE